MAKTRHFGVSSPRIRPLRRSQEAYGTALVPRGSRCRRFSLQVEDWRMNRRPRWGKLLWLSLAAGLSLAVRPPARAADLAKIGVVKSTLSAPLYVAVAKGYFEEEGIDAQIMFIEAAQMI